VWFCFLVSWGGGVWVGWGEGVGLVFSGGGVSLGFSGVGMVVVTVSPRSHTLQCQSPSFRH